LERGRTSAGQRSGRPQARRRGRWPYGASKATRG
jgi:DNA invertase Pin-like site-specific DNA recombinase